LKILQSEYSTSSYSFSNINNSCYCSDIIGTKVCDIDHRVVSYCGANGNKRNQLLHYGNNETRFVKRHARVSRFPRRKRGINSRALVVRCHSRRWYFVQVGIIYVIPDEPSLATIYIRHIERERKK